MPGSVITFDPDTLQERLTELEHELSAPGFWDDQQHAAAVSAEHSRVAKRLERYEHLTREYEEAKELLELDGDLEGEIAHAAPADSTASSTGCREDALFSGEYDTGDAVVTIQSATGGTDAQDWAEMLLRMYQRWAERRGFDDEPRRGERQARRRA